MRRCLKALRSFLIGNILWLVAFYETYALILTALYLYLSLFFFRDNTVPDSIISLGMKMKMDLCLVVTNSSELQDHGYGEVAKERSTSKYFKKRKIVVASKALLNSIVQQNAINHEKHKIRKKIKNSFFISFFFKTNTNQNGYFINWYSTSIP